jgi:hypothetical protein
MCAWKSKKARAAIGLLLFIVLHGTLPGIGIIFFCVDVCYKK